MSLLTKLSTTDAARGSQPRFGLEFINAIAALSLNEALTAAGTALATTATKAKTVNTLTYLSAGAFKSKAGTDNLWTLGVAGSATTVAVASFQKYMLLLDGSGTATVQEATPSPIDAAHVVWTNVSGLSTWAPLLTVLNAGKTVVAVVTVATDGTHTFIPGTTAFNATGITSTFADGVDQSLLPLLANEQGTIVGLGG